jgi:hypothetical protein
MDGIFLNLESWKLLISIVGPCLVFTLAHWTDEDEPGADEFSDDYAEELSRRSVGR